MNSTLPTHGIATENSRTRLTVDNIKCGGCAKTITHAMTDLNFKNVSVDPDASTVEMDSPASSQDLIKALSKLKELGYPLIDTEEGLKALALKAKSYVSCALGKMS